MRPSVRHFLSRCAAGIVTGTGAAALVFVIVALWTGGGPANAWPEVAAFLATFAFALAGQNRRRAWGRGFLVNAILAAPIPLTLAFPSSEVLDGNDEIAVAKGVAALAAMTISSLVAGVCLIASHRSFYGR